MNGENNIPIGIGGAIALILMAIVPFIPRITEAIILILKNIGTRMSAKTDEHLKEMDAFQILQSEVTHLRKERENDQRRITAAEQKAEQAGMVADEALKTVDRLETRVDQLQRELDRAQGALQSKDQRIADQDSMIFNLLEENGTLRRENAELKKELSLSITGRK